MALVLDDTLGGANSNTFLSRADADTYAEADFYGTVWNDATDAQKDQTLVMATKRLCLEKYYGDRETTTQALCFPRLGIGTIDGIAMDSIIPPQIKEATYQLAKYMLSVDMSMKKAVEQTTKKEKVGSLEVEYAVNESGSFTTYSDSLPSMVSALVGDLSRSVTDGAFFDLSR